MIPMRLVLLGDGPWATESLNGLIEAGHLVAGVVARRSPSEGSLVDAAARLGIPLYRPDAINAPETVQALRALAPDLLLSIAYNQILGAAARAVAPRGAVNIHAGMLPHYRGRNVINWALINGESEIGITAHFMDDGIDTGDIILQRGLPVGWTETYGDVLARVVGAIPRLVTDTVALIAAGHPPTRPQRHLRGTYFGGRGEGDEWLDWTSDAVSLHNKVRAISRPGPGARSSVHGRTFTIWRAFHDRSWPSYQATAGQVVGREAGGALVKTGDSMLLVQEVETDDGTIGPPAWPLGTRLDVNRTTALLDRLAAAEPTLVPGGSP